MGVKIDSCKKRVSPNYYFCKKMSNLGIAPGYIGYYYLVDILNILINEDKQVHSFSTEVYPVIAEKYDKKACTVERNIRNIINVLWSKKLKDELSAFWAHDRKPKCCEFIFILKNYMIQDLI